MTPRELIAELAALTKAEKAEVVERLAQEISDSWPGIEKTPGVAGGDRHSMASGCRASMASVGRTSRAAGNGASRPQSHPSRAADSRRRRER
jgi:hypothetical protein